MGRKALSAAVAAGLAVTLSGCWVQPGFDAGHTYYNASETTITSANVATLVPRWTADVGTGVVEEPLSVNGRVFAVATDDSSGPHRATAVDAATGELIWSTVLTEAVSGYSVHDPVYIDGNVAVPYSAFRIGGIDSVSAATGAPFDEDLDGQANWQLAVVDGGLVTTSFSQGSAPFPPPFMGTVEGSCFASISGLLSRDPLPLMDFAFVGSDLMWGQGPEAVGFAGCNPATGGWATRWRTPLAGEATGVAALGGDDVAYTDATGTVTALDSSSGTLNWAVDVDAAEAPTASAAGDLFVTTTDQRLVVLNGATGAVKWEAAIGGPSTLAVGGDVAYVADTATGSIRAFARTGCGAATCTPLATIEVGTALSSGPVVDDGRLLVGTTDGRLVAFGLPS